MPHSDLAPMKPQVYLDPRPAEYFEPFHEYVRAREAGVIYPVTRALSYPPCRLLYRLRAQDLDRVPDRGPVILAPNHFSGMDHWFVSFLLRRQVHWMAKSQLFKGRALEWFLSRIGAFPVRRGQHDEEAIITAETILGRGGVIVMYVEGGRSRSGQIGDLARPGIGRIALETGSPIVPVAIQGSERARNWKRLEFPQVTVRYGEPMGVGVEPNPSRERQQQLADRVLAEVRSMYDGLAE
jgi:1-acyl-sn-glycerol-3-phosphate acyltransferase